MQFIEINVNAHLPNPSPLYCLTNTVADRQYWYQKQLNWYIFLHSSWRSLSLPARLQSKLESPWRWRLKICMFRWRTSPKQNRRSVQLSGPSSQHFKSSISNNRRCQVWQSFWLGLLHILQALHCSRKKLNLSQHLKMITSVNHLACIFAGFKKAVLF